MSNETILIVDDEKNILRSIEMTLRAEGYNILTSETAQDALTRAEKHIDLAIIDILLPDINGLQLLEMVRRRQPDIVVIIMSGHGTISTAVQATKLGAYDFLEKPISMDKLLLTVRRALEFRRLENENIALRTEIARKYDIIGESPVMRELFRRISMVGNTSTRVLIRGENGTGKELVARAIHDAGPRRDKPFIRVNCAAIPHELIESELFGHEKGAFTGAVSMRRGKFELANTGTIFLDEIGDMHLDTQAKVLRVLQEEEFERVGGSQTTRVDVRVIAATNKDLEKAIDRGTFREDLYFRLNVIPIHVPALRDRIADIPLLAVHFFNMYTEEYGFKDRRLAPSALELLKTYSWPGNVRELKNILERIFIMSPTDIVDDTVVREVFPHEQAAAPVEVSGDAPLRDVLTEFERTYIIQKLKENENHVGETAKKLQIERSHLYKKIRAFGIPLS